MGKRRRFESPGRFMMVAARALLNYVGGGFIADIVVDVGPAVVRDVRRIIYGTRSEEVVPPLAEEVWKEWGPSSEEDRRLDLEELAGMDDAAADEAAAVVVAALGAGHSVEATEQVAAYLRELPATVRSTLRRPEDPRGLSVSQDLIPQKEADLYEFLPQRMATLKAGYEPLADADVVLEHLLGIGGFGEVWLARDRGLDQPLVLKFCVEEKAQASLRREVDLLRRIQKELFHPGIVRLTNVYLRAKVPCLAYDYVEGGTLARWIRDQHKKKGGVDISAVRRIFFDLLETMVVAHSLRPAIVHRDLKPANILMSSHHRGVPYPKITDFGIGSLSADEALAAERRAMSVNVSLTHSARGSYTPLYASPEQRSGEKADPRDDVYSLGVIFFQMLTGDQQKGAPTGGSWKKRLREKGLSEAEVELLERCFEDRAERPVHAGEFLAALKDASTSSTTSGSSAPVASPLPQRVIEVSAPVAPPKKQLIVPGGFEMLGTETVENRARLVRHAESGLEFILVRPGKFLRGSPDSDNLAYGDEKPRREVELTKWYYLAKYPVTFEAFRRFRPDHAKGLKYEGEPMDGAKQPVVNASWHDVVAYCESFEHKLRLPTEAEWEYAARAGTTTRFFWGDDPAGGKGFINGADPKAKKKFGWSDDTFPFDDGYLVSSPVDAMKANPWGFHDMLGNVREWCADWYSEKYYSDASSLRDPKGPESGESRVARGGSWGSFPQFARAAYRGTGQPGFTDDRIGFRPAVGSV